MQLRGLSLERPNTSLPRTLGFVLLLAVVSVFFSQYEQVYLRGKMAASVRKEAARTHGDTERVYLVTGVAGYIGSHMALALLERGENVVGVDNMSRGSNGAIKVLEAFPLFIFERMDLGDSEDLERLFDSYSFHTVFHFAAVASASESFDKPELYKMNNTQNTWRLADTMIRHGVRTLHLASSCTVYGEPDTFPVTETTKTAPISPYGESKLDAENYLRYRASTNFHVEVFRYFNVVGSDSKGRLRENPSPSLGKKYGRLWTACLDVVFKRRPCVTLFDTELDTPDGSEIRDYVHVEDVVNAHLEILKLKQRQRPFEVWNVATNTPTSTIEFVEAARRVTGAFIPICFANEQKRHSGSKLYGSSHHLSEMSNWRPAYTEIEKMLQTAWETRRIRDDWASKHYDVCVVGAGLSAAVLAERHVRTLGHSVLVVEKRNHIGGNCYDYIDKETGIRVSKYGVHLFHTKYDRVWEYLQRFSDWTPWEHRCVAKVGNKHIPVPVNIDSVNTLFNLSISSENEMKEWLKQEQILPSSGNLTDSEEVALSRVGSRLYDMIFKPYTIKQWNKEPKELGPSVLARIPVRTNHDDRYFTDPYQALPTDGYTRIFENMFNSPKITLRLNTDFFNVRKSMNCGHTYFTGPIDSFYAAKGLPKLEYRSLTFERRVFHNTTFYQPRAHVNYPAMSYNYTRAIEYKHIFNQSSPDTVVFFERSSDVGEPYYPVPNKANQELYAKYQRMAEREPNVTFVGRLANYKYFNMDQTVLNALELFDQESRTCTPGVFSNVQQWKSLFRGRTTNVLGLQKKAMIFIPVGAKSAETVGSLVEYMGTDHFHFLLVRYDNYDWSRMSWFDKVEWLDQPKDSGTNWSMAKLFLTPPKVKSFSHVCVWDDDLAPTELFDGPVFLQWLQQLNLEIAQPMIRRNAHGYYDGLPFGQRPSHTHVHQVELVEIMAPCYSTKVWSSCIWPRIIQEFSTGWGIDSNLHNAFCAPASVYSVGIPLDHMDDNGLDKKNGGNEMGFYTALSEERHWGKRQYPRPFKDFRVVVDNKCHVTMEIAP